MTRLPRLALCMLPVILILLIWSPAPAQDEPVPPPGEVTPSPDEPAPSPEEPAPAPAEATPSPEEATSAPDEAVSTSEIEGVSIGKVIEWGGAIGYFIISLSVITLMLVAFHLVSLRRSALFSVEFRDKTAKLFRGRRIKEASELAGKDKSLLGRTISAGLGQISGGYSEMEQIMNDVAEDEAMRMEQGIGYFSLIAAIAPLCGLLGTVVGMIVAFHEIAMRGVVTPKELADPIQKALVTTCLGLIVAIPNVIAYTVFRNRLHKLLAELGIVVEELMMPFRSVTPRPTMETDEFTRAAHIAAQAIEAEAAKQKGGPDQVSAYKSGAPTEKL